MNQKVKALIIVMCAIAGFVTPLYLYDIAPDSKEISIQLRPGEIPPDAIRVFDMRDIETVGEVKQVFGTYDFYKCNQTYVSAIINKQKDIIEFSVRGINTTSNETFDYRFQKNVPNSDRLMVLMVSYSDAGNILLFNNENIVVEYYKGIGDDFASLGAAIVAAGVLGLISFLLISRLEIILESNLYRKAKRFVNRGKK